MNNKLSSNTFLIAIVVIFVAATAYLIIANKTAPSGQTKWNLNTDQNIPPANTPPVNVNVPVITTINYQNTQYGFNFTLPISWNDYSIVNSEWVGNVSGPKGDTPTEKGAIISIRHPLWTAAVPRQDIPVMVFTISQWNDLQADKFHIGAAPIGPSELGRNAKYVFALPARYNFAFPAGYEEVDAILQGKPLNAF